MERKFTDEEIVKALERCIACNDKQTASCDDCLLEKYYPYCDDELEIMCLDLIKRQKAEIQRLNFENLQMIANIKHLKAEAIKEFAERLKAKAMLQHGGVTVVYGSDIDNIVKEMTEGKT